MRKFETKLPAGYQEAAHISGAESGFWNDLKTVLPGLALAAVGCFCVKPSLGQIVLSLPVFLASIYPYFVLHELVHAAVYCAMTRQKVKIRFTKGGACCWMPDVYVYRGVANTCTAAPLVAFGILLTAGSVAAIVSQHWLFLPASLLLALHLLGCRSDVNLLREIGMHPGNDILIRDNGTEQWIYRSAAEVS